MTPIRIRRQHRRVMAALDVVMREINEQLDHGYQIENTLGRFELDDTDVGLIEKELLSIRDNLERRLIKNGITQYQQDKKRRQAE